MKKVPKVGPLSSRSLEEQAEQAELRARLGNVCYTLVCNFRAAC